MPKILDAHVHLPTKEFIVDAGGPLVESGLSYFGTKDPIRSIERMVEDFRGAGISKALLLAWDAETATRRKPLTNDRVAEIARNHSDLFVPILSVDPHKGQKAIAELDRAASRLEMRGVKLHPQAQAFLPNDPLMEPLWKKIEELRLPTIVHTGTSGLGAGAPGGGGIKLEYGRPLLLDSVAARHPDLKLLCAHTGWPWHEELIAMALQKPNVFFDLSGWMPKFLPKEVLTFTNGPARKKVLFGTDYPFLDPKAVLAQFNELDLKPDVKERVLWQNGAELWGL